MDYLVEFGAIGASGNFCQLLYLKNASDALEGDEFERFLQVRPNELLKEQDEAALSFFYPDQI